MFDYKVYFNTLLFLVTMLTINVQLTGFDKNNYNIILCVKKKKKTL